MATSVIVQDTEGEQHYQEALAICSLYALLDQSIRYALHTIFGPSTDKRVKRGGNIFIAHLLRFGTLVQLSLFPGTEICDYARIVIPNILVFTKDPSWPWCYDTTLKYINLLVAAGILITKPEERGIYYLPMGPYVLLQEHAKQQIEQLAGKRTKISRSAAYLRTMQHCLAPPNAGLPEFAGSPVLSDEAGVQQALKAITAVLQRRQGVTLLPKTLSEIMSVLATHIPQAFHTKKTPFLTMHASVLVSDRESVTQNGEQKEPGSEGENLPLHGNSEIAEERESTISRGSQPVGDEVVDSSCATLTESLSSLKKSLYFSEISEFTINGLRRSTLSAESTLSHQLADSPDVQREHEFTDEEIAYWARELSRFMNGNHAKVGHYRALLQQSPVVLHIAIVDALVRSVFPDPRRRKAKLGGGWVTGRFRAYLAGGEEVPPEIYAWSQTGLPYLELQQLLEAECMYQEAAGADLYRPFPDEAHNVITSTALDCFWQEGGAHRLQEEGCWYVEVNGELLTPIEYQQLRQRAIGPLLIHQPPVESSQTPALFVGHQQHGDREDAELLAYLEWYTSRPYSPEEIEYLLDHMRPEVRELIVEQVKRLQKALDGDRYDVGVVLLPIRHGTPIERGLVIKVRTREDPREGWILRSKKDVECFIAESGSAYGGRHVLSSDSQETSGLVEVSHHHMQD